MENTEIRKAKGMATDINRSEAQDTRASPNNLETHLVRK